MTAQTEFRHRDIWTWHFKIAPIFHFSFINDLLTYFQFSGSMTFQMVPGREVLLQVLIFVFNLIFKVKVTRLRSFLIKTAFICL